jgi:NitT/TauT family transport system ATP-binding protein
MYQPTSGELLCEGREIRGLNRRVTYMTQKDTLLPWRTALDNAALPLEIKGVGKAERYEKTRVALNQVGVGDFEHRRPHQLSGGMRSRLSLARALLSESDIFLMDEPFAAIDALLRVRLQQLLLSVWEQTHNTLIYVTHDLNEAIALGHRVMVMSTRPGTIALEKVIDAPQPRDVGRFRNTPEAQALYVELWDALERQLSK